MMLLSSACTYSSSPPKAESKSLFIPLEGGDSTCAFLQRGVSLYNQCQEKTGWMYPTLTNSMLPAFSLDTSNLPRQLWSNEGDESILDHHIPWQLHWGHFLYCASPESNNAAAIDSCLQLNVYSLSAHWRLPLVFLVLSFLIKVLHHVDKSVWWWPIRVQYHW